MVNSKPGDTGGSKKKSESKPLDLSCENSDFLFRATCVIVSTDFLKIIILHQKRRYQSDPIRNAIRVLLTALKSPVRLWIKEANEFSYPFGWNFL